MGESGRRVRDKEEEEEEAKREAEEAETAGERGGEVDESSGARSTACQYESNLLYLFAKQIDK